MSEEGRRGWEDFGFPKDKSGPVTGGFIATPSMSDINRADKGIETLNQRIQDLEADVECLRNVLISVIDIAHPHIIGRAAAKGLFKELGIEVL